MASSVESDLAALAGVRIFFGHQSVGDNILQGVSELLVHQPDALTIEMLTGTAALESAIPSTAAGAAARVTRSAPRQPAALVHAKIGRNEDPSSKCDDFRRIIDQGLAGPVDVALFKFCYIDIHPGTNVEALATTYISCLDGLAQSHPETVFLPVTVPLRQTPGGPGVWARQLLGRTNQTKVANARRYAFNQQLRTRYAGRPLFDLAAAEATGAERPARNVRAGGHDRREPARRLHRRWRSPERRGKGRCSHRTSACSRVSCAHGSSEVIFLVVPQTTIFRCGGCFVCEEGTNS